MFSTADQTGLAMVTATVGAPTVTPRGRKGLWGALASASAPSVRARSLPLSDVSAGGPTVSMFDYDVTLAVSLDDDL